jgi:toxin ParE1/3/4
VPAVFSSRAVADLTSIVEYIARDSPRSARRVAENIQATADRLASMPGMGRTRGDLGFPDLRTWYEPPCVLVYRQSARRGVEIVRVAHEKQDLARLLR